MATITTDQYLDASTARTAGETWTLNGGKLTIRTDTRWHSQSPASMTGSLSTTTISASLGGGVLIDGRNVRWIPYNSGTGNVPSIGQSITQGGVTGYLLAVYDSLTVAPTAVGAAMPADGFLKFREVTSGPFSAGALTGIGASATGPDVTGWIEVVQDQSSVITVSRKGSGHVVRGDWFYLDDTNGSIAQVLQVPTNGGGANTYCPGVWIETGVGTDEYEYWPELASTTMAAWTAASLGAPEGGTDRRQSFVKGIGSGQMQIGETVTQAATFAPVAQAGTYTWANDIVTVTFTAHTYNVGESVYLDFTSGGGTPDGVYVVESVVSANVFTVALAGAGTSGNVSIGGRTTVTFTAHGLSVGQTAYFDGTSGTFTDGTYEIISTTANTMIIAIPQITVAGNVTVRLTIGRIPVSGCKTRIPNVIMRQCTTGARATNARPHATIGSRPIFTTTGAGAIDHEYAYSDWYYNFAQPYAIRLQHVAAGYDAMAISECATAIDMLDGGISMNQELDAVAFTVTSCFAGGTVSGWKFHRGNAPGTTDHAVTLSLSRGIDFSACEAGIVRTPRSTGIPWNVSQCSDLTFDDCRGINGANGMTLTTCLDIEINDWDHVDRFIGVTNAVAANYVIAVITKCSGVLIDGITEGYAGTIPRVHAYAGLLNVTASGDVRLRNAGTYAAPLGSTVKINERGYLYVSGGNNNDVAIQRVFASSVRTGLISDTNSDKGVLYERVSAPYLSTRLPYTLTVAALNAQTRGVVAPLLTVAANASVYGTHWWDAFTSWDRLLSTYTWAANLVTVTSPTHGLSVGDKVYLDFTSGGGTPDGVYTVKTITSATVFVVALSGSGTAGNLVAYRALTSTPATWFTNQGRLHLPLNEPSAETTGYVPITGTAQFTSSPSLTLPSTSDEVTVETQEYIQGHTGFPNIPPTLTGTQAVGASAYTWAANVVTVTLASHGLAVGDKVWLDATSGGLTPDGIYTVASVTSTSVYTIALTGSGTAGNVNVYRLNRYQYKLDTGSGYGGSWQSLLYYRPSCSTTSGTATITMIDTTDIAVDDYVYGIGVGVDAKVVSIDSGTQITVSVNSVATGSNLLLSFNHLPNETISTPFKIKVRFTCDTPGTTAATTYLTIPTMTSSADQSAIDYPLDTVTVTVTVKDVTTNDPIEGARVYVTAASGGPAVEGTVILSGVTDVSGVLSGTTRYIDQPVIGRARRATTGLGSLYKSGALSDTVTSSGLSATVLMIPDE